MQGGNIVDILTEAKRVFDIEIKALQSTRDELDETFVKILDSITHCKGKLIITGMGKPGHIAAKLAATFASLGTPSFCLHPAEAMHGDLGMISSDDIVIAISFSGESDEIIRILPNIKMLGAYLIGITGNKDSTLANASDIVQILPKFEEACYLELAPTSSTTAVLCYGDALAVVASGVYGFKDEDYGKLHPAGSLGKRLILRTNDLMAKGDAVPKVFDDTILLEALSVMTSKGLGVVSVVDNSEKLIGIITDGDLRRIIEKHVDFYTCKVSEVMTVSPKRMTPDKLAVEALKYIRETQINSLPVVDAENRLIGTITWQMIIRAGIVA